MRKYKKKNFEGHSESDKKNSWYWSVLMRNYKNYKEAEQQIYKSKRWADPSYDGYWKI